MSAHPRTLDNPYGVSESFDAWPKAVGQHLIEPGSDVVVLRRRGREPLVLAVDDARRLAAAAPLSRLSEVLRECADEAARQQSQLGLGAAA